MLNFCKVCRFIFSLLLSVSFLCSVEVKGQNVIQLSKSTLLASLGQQIEYYIDTAAAFDSSSIINCRYFSKNKSTVPVFIHSQHDIWLKFTVQNNMLDSQFFLRINYPNISHLWLYKANSGNTLSLINHTGNATNYNTRMFDNINFTFPFEISPSEKQTYYFKISSKHPIELPISITDSNSEVSSYYIQHFIIGTYLGIIISILLYNAFLFFSTKDKSYLLYVVYLFFLGFAQITFSGWSFKYLWPSHPEINFYSIVWTSGLAGISGVAFGKSFLNSPRYAPKLNKVLSILILLYIVSLITILFKQTLISYLILNVNGFLVGIFLLLTSIIIIKEGYRTAYFYLFAWSFFLFALIVFVLRNMGIIPTNNFTHSVLYLGSSLEAILLSIALADRINVLKREKEISQAEALQKARENEQLVNQQNIMLEEKVALRTEELQNANSQLNEALDNLKDTQTQLVEAEKMASLGQLTAGIAHEINNPINFVKSNINPLRLDVKDLLEILNAYDELHHINGSDTYKQKLDTIQNLKESMDVSYIQTEIDNLISGIEDGAERTAEIVRGLRTFSRIDEAALKTVNIHDGILSTLVLLKNNTPFYVNVIKEFNADGEIECFPGKLNQVFMNIITNAIQAIKAKPVKADKETITIKTRDIENKCIEISIKDSGIGMSEETKHHIFEPFFTTKDIGEGTGLGMAIVFKIIQKHSGKININSIPNDGAEFVITLPHCQDAKD